MLMFLNAHLVPWALMGALWYLNVAFNICFDDKGFKEEGRQEEEKIKGDFLGDMTER